MEGQSYLYIVPLYQLFYSNLFKYVKILNSSLQLITLISKENLLSVISARLSAVESLTARVDSLEAGRLRNAVEIRTPTSTVDSQLQVRTKFNSKMISSIYPLVLSAE